MILCRAIFKNKAIQKCVFSQYIDVENTEPVVLSETFWKSLRTFEPGKNRMAKKLTTGKYKSWPIYFEKEFSY